MGTADSSTIERASGKRFSDFLIVLETPVCGELQPDVFWKQVKVKAAGRLAI